MFLSTTFVLERLIRRQVSQNSIGEDTHVVPALGSHVAVHLDHVFYAYCFQIPKVHFLSIPADSKDAILTVSIVACSDTRGVPVLKKAVEASIVDV